MRAPSAAELLGDFVDTLAADADEALRYADADLAPAADPALIDDAAMARAVKALNALRMNDPERLGDWFGRFITLYRNAGEVMAAPQDRSRIEIEWDLRQGGRLQRHPWSRMAWRKCGRQARLYVNGQDHALPVADAKCVANSGELDSAAYESLSPAGRDCVIELLSAGHYRLARPGGLEGDEDE
jgi:50S ribosomal protein L16 3-hydroxylase